MESLKIRVNSKAESKEAQELFFELGYEKGAIADYHPSWISNFHEFTPQERKYTSEPVDHWLRACKEITLPELRDLVVLKRNDVGDATHENNHGQKLYKAQKGWYIYALGSWLWNEESLGYLPIELKPITKDEGMKEYLDPENGYKLNLTDRPFFDWIEIPDGANFAWKSDGKYVFFTALEMGYRDASVVWSRHTIPEELPFIDDSYKLDYDGSEQEEIESLNSQYAEIEKVRQTLSQRQEQYGSFEDVAMITEQMVDAMRKGYYENLAYNQKMALYMICSKMARIVNGNPNHKDSWHDIAGYATLIDNELVSEKDMPF